MADEKKGINYAKERIAFDEMANNQSIRVLICLCVDSSYSMMERMKSLNEGVQGFIREMCQDKLAVDATELCIVSFGDKITVDCKFDNVRKALDHRVVANGAATRMGAGVEMALKCIDQRLQELEGHLYYLPWLIIISDGDATDPDVCKKVSEEVIGRQKNHKLKVKCLSMGEGSRTLQQFLVNDKVDTLEDLKVMDFFSMLSRSVSSVSQESINHGEFSLEQ